MTRASMVKLNVGGTRYVASRETLCNYGPNLFGSILDMVDRRVPFPTDESGHLFIDRSGILFEWVLQVLRSGRLTCPSHIPTSALEEELRFFQIQIPHATVPNEAAQAVASEMAALIREHQARAQGMVELFLVQNRDRLLEDLKTADRTQLGYGGEGIVLSLAGLCCPEPFDSRLSFGYLSDMLSHQTGLRVQVLGADGAFGLQWIRRDISASPGIVNSFDDHIGMPAQLVADVQLQ
eukprot:c15592_g1_i1.p1 GENE.c15592_g1_i1~~c15592_g1_i1.p1  ORF type:complete len:257 (+),score=32.58 c15592_g1_i1:62-772(+)